MQLSKKQKSFSEYFTPFLKSASSFENFETKDGPHSVCISDITDYQKHA